MTASQLVGGVMMYVFACMFLRWTIKDAIVCAYKEIKKEAT
jgi:hypothetical protein